MKNYQINRQVIYKQIKQKIVELIRDGVYTPAKPLPSEIQLAGQFSVSQGSIRQALEELSRENVLYRIQGKGTFVSDYSNEEELFRFFKINNEDGNKIIPKSEFIECHKIKGEQAIKEKLNVAQSESLYKISRYRCLENVRQVYEILFMPVSIFPSLHTKDIPNHIYSLYSSEYGKVVGKVTESIKATCTPKVAKELNLPEDTPLLLIERITTDIEETPIELRKTWLNTEHCYYCNQLT